MKQRTSDWTVAAIALLGVWAILWVSDADAQELITAAAAENSRAGRYEWMQVAVIDGPLAVDMHYLARSTFNSVLRANGFRAPYRETHGFAILRRITSTNGVVSYQCDIYLTLEASSRVMEHELRHCDGWDHR